MARRIGWLLLVLVHGTSCSTIREPVPSPPEPPLSGTVAGELVVAAMDPAEPVVVYLEPLEVEAAPRRSGRTSTVQLRGSLRPDFLAVARGDAVRFLNDDRVYHHFFSASKPNDFDTGLLGRGEASVVRMQAPGVVRLYSALDETASGVIYVAPSPYFAIVHPPGRFEIEDVPVGRYQLRTWREDGAPVCRELLVEPGVPTGLQIHVEGTAQP